MRLIFQISLLVLVSLCSIILAGAEEFPLVLLTIPIATLAWWFADHLKIVRLNFWVAAGLAIAAIFFGVFEFRTFREQSVLGAGGHVLCYLQWIYLCRVKDVHTYLWIFALCLMQVAVASLLTFSIWFGIGLLAFGLMATWTMSIFLLYRSDIVQASLSKIEDEQSVKINSSLGPIWNSVSKGPETNLFGFGYISNLFAMFVLSLIVGSFFFFLVPRFPVNTAFGTPITRASQSVSGFSNQVRLGDLGEVLEDASEVMTVEIFDTKTGGKLNQDETQDYLGFDPLFRGAVLESYANSMWEHDLNEEYSRLYFQGASTSHRIHFEMKPVTKGTLFTTGRIMAAAPAESNITIERGVFSEMLRASYKTSRGTNFSYDILVGSKRPDQSLSLMNSLNFLQSNAEFVRYQEITRQVPPECEALGPVARRVAGNLKRPRDIANAMVDWFTETGGFTYSTKLSIDDARIDPLVDFVLNRKTGHCEYYASAMAVMLRTQNISARVITGYKGGAWNGTVQAYVVQQLHAHAWVEALIDDAWVVFDPTPATREEEIEKMNSSSRFFSKNWLAAEMVWSKLTGLNQATQHDRIYMPILEALTDLQHSLLSIGKSSTDLLAQSGEFLRNPSRLISLQGGIIAAVAMLILLGLSLAVQAVLKSYRKWLTADKLRNQQAVDLTKVVPFYQRLLQVLKARGIEQLPTQTATEFVSIAQRQVQPFLKHPLTASWPEQVVRMFNQVRFGGAPLTVGQLEQIEKTVNELETAIQGEDHFPQ